MRADRDDIRRLKGIIGALRIIIEKNSDGSGMARMAFLMSTFTEELADELEDLPEMQVRLFMYQIGEVISWIGHGQNERLPEGVREFAEMIQPTVSGNDDDGTDTGSHREFDSQSG